MQRRKNLSRSSKPPLSNRRSAKVNTSGNRKPSGAIRIISGQWRGRKLSVLDAEGLRPTTDRTKETLFNWLMQDIVDRHCLDAFSGSGGLGIEALSRGASAVTFVELNKYAAQNITSNLSLLQVSEDKASVIQSDTLQFLQSINNDAVQYDLVFLDPPFNKGFMQPCINLLQQRNLLATDALVYLEMEAGLSELEVPQSWSLLKEKATQQMHYQLWIVNQE